VPRPFQGQRQDALMLGAHACLLAWLNLSPLRQEPPQLGRVLVIDVVYVVGAETADPPAMEEPPAASLTPVPWPAPPLP